MEEAPPRSWWTDRSRESCDMLLIRLTGPPPGEDGKEREGGIPGRAGEEDV